MNTTLPFFPVHAHTLPCDTAEGIVSRSKHLAKMINLTFRPGPMTFNAKLSNSARESRFGTPHTCSAAYTAFSHLDFAAHKTSAIRPGDRPREPRLCVVERQRETHLGHRGLPPKGCILISLRQSGETRVGDVDKHGSSKHQNQSDWGAAVS